MVILQDFINFQNITRILRNTLQMGTQGLLHLKSSYCKNLQQKSQKTLSEKGY